MIIKFIVSLQIFLLTPKQFSFAKHYILVVVVARKSIHSRSDTNGTGVEDLSFYYPRLLNCSDQMLAVMLLSQHWVLSSNTVIHCATCGAQCMGHVIRTWSAVCLEAPHYAIRGRSETPFVHGRVESPNTSPQAVELNPNSSQKPIPTALVLVLGIKTRSLEVFSQYSTLYLWFFHSEGRMPIRQVCLKNSVQLAQMGV